MWNTHGQLEEQVLVMQEHADRLSKRKRLDDAETARMLELLLEMSSDLLEVMALLEMQGHRFSRRRRGTT